MRFKTFLFRLFKSVRFWIVLIAALLALLFVLISCEEITKPETPPLPYMEASSVNVDITIDTQGIITTTEKHTYNSAGVAHFIGWGYVDEVAIQCAGGEEEIIPVTDFQNISTQDEDYVPYDDMDDFILSSGQRAVGGRDLWVVFPDERECDVTFSDEGLEDKDGHVSTYTDLAGTWDIGVGGYMEPKTVVYHLPVPEDESLKDVTAVEINDENDTARITAGVDTITITGADHSYLHVSVLFPLHWIEADGWPVHDEDYPSTERGHTYPMKRVDFSGGDEVVMETPEVAWKHVSLSDVHIGWFIASGFVLIGGFVLAYVWRKKKRGDVFSGKYWRDVPDEELDPVVVGRLWAHNSELQAKRDVSVVVMSLIHKNAVTLEEREGQYRLIRIKNYDEKLSEVEKATCSVLFVKGQTVTFSELEKCKGEIEAQVNEVVDKCLDGVEATVRLPRMVLIAGGLFIIYCIYFIAGLRIAITQQHINLPLMTLFLLLGLAALIALFPEVSFSWNEAGIRWLFWGLAIFFGIVAVVLANNYSSARQFDKFWISIIFTVWSVAYAMYGLYVSRRPNRVADIVAKAEGLKKWLEDFTMLDERPPSDVKVWGEFMVYATAFGIADAVQKELGKLGSSVLDESVLYSMARFAKEKLFSEDEA